MRMKPFDGWLQRPLTARLVVVSVAAMLLVAGPPALRRLTRDSGAAAGIEAYRYRFERSTRGSVTRALENEIAFYQERISGDPQGGLDLALLGGAYLKMARATGDLSWYLLAEQAARRSLANLPFQNDGAVLVLAKVAEARHDFTEAIRLAARAAGREDALAIMVSANLAAGNVNAAGRAAETLAARAPTLGSLTLRALVKIGRGADEEAVADFRQAIAAEEPGEPGASALARTLLGRFHAKRGQLDMARGLYQEALRILPQYPLALVNLAELEARAERYKVVERYYGQVVTVTAASPNIYDHVVLRGLARVKELQGDGAGAKTLWEQAEARLRRDVTAGTFGHRRELARLLLERGRAEDVTEALALVRAEVRRRRDPDTLGILAWALSRAGRPGEARETVREALRWGVRDAALFYQAGTIEQALGNRSQADAFFRAARETDPTFDELARRVLGMGF